MFPLILTALLGGPQLTAAVSPFPASSPATCQVESSWTGHRSILGQYLIEIRLPPTCPRNAGRLARIVTRQGGIIPPIGYFPLGGGYPRALRYWVLSPAYVQDRFAPNDWRAVPIRLAPWPLLEASWVR